MANPYRELLAIPGVMGLVVASSIARLPQAMIGIITMLVQQTGLYWLAGAVAGTFTLANALVGPQISKRVDRLGQRRVLPVFSAFSIAMLLALIAAAHWRADAPLLFVLAALAGTMPSMPAMPMAQQFFIGVLVTAITALLPIFSPGVYFLALMLFISGVSFAPTMVIVMNLGTLILPPQRVTEGLTWMSTGISIGVAFGGVVAGLVIDVYGPRAGFAVPIVAGVVMVLIVMLGLRTLRAAVRVQSRRDIV